MIRSVRVGDVVLGIGALSLGIAVFVMTLRFPRMPGGMPGPGLFPQVLALLLVAFGLACLWQGRKAEEGGEAVALPPRQASLRAVIVLGSGFVFLAILPHVGFSLAAFALLLFQMLLLGVPLRRALPISVLIVVFTVLLFEQLLRVPLPRGFIGN